MFRRPWAALRRDPVLTVLLLALVVLQTGWPRPWASLPGLVDWQTILTLTGLLWLTKAVELSGFLDWLAQRLVSRLRNERMLALLMVGFAAGLATVLTNDVALFVVVPLALSLARIAPLRIERLIVFLALAVNAGSTLTPLGNPQNLFLWQASGTSFALFVAWMAPLAAGLMLLLLALTAVAFDARPLHLSERGARHGVAWRHFALLAALFAAFIVLTDHHQVVWACALAAAGCLALQRRALRAIDWLLLLIFVLMFVVLRLLAGLPEVHAQLARIDLSVVSHVYWSAALVSQVISNVPAAILLAEYSHQWRALAYGVSVGGFGFAVGSLANLIALRMAGTTRIWWKFHMVSIPFFIATTLIGLGVLRFIG
ncbi:MAG: citrate transporter [Burkholderiales bacterium]|nr:citrate transporter [Burkholderiales bacterium]MDE2288390.1 citrate transporter [Burkholderiales bacterium]MDE2609230.1 citrate transporter [Burkholderiales bacterium]